MGKMFPFITETWNPVAGSCPYDCSYCWAKSLIKRHSYAKYQGIPRLDDRAMSKIPDKGFIFVQDMSDISTLDADSARLLMTELAYRKNAEFLLLTKNPVWYLNMITPGNVDFPPNVIFGATIETNRDIDPKITLAPLSHTRFWGLEQVKKWLPSNRTFISVEPIMDFDVVEMNYKILDAKPWAVAVGYDNYHNNLPEPTLAKTKMLISGLRRNGVTVYEKTLREAVP